MLYVLALIILLFAIFFVYFIKIISTFIAAHRAHKIAKRDPEAQVGDVIERPSFRAVAREVTHAMFPPRQQQNPHDPMHRRNSAELARANWNSSLATAVVRVETRDGELPSYQDSANMPKPPQAVYSESVSTPTATRIEADQATAPGYVVGAPPQYHEQPLARRRGLGL